MTFHNEAAWQTAPNSKSFEIKPGPIPNPSEDEVVIKVAYAAVNPVDWKVSTTTTQHPDTSNKPSSKSTHSTYPIHTSSAPTSQEQSSNSDRTSVDSS